MKVSPFHFSVNALCFFALHLSLSLSLSNHLNLPVPALPFRDMKPPQLGSSRSDPLMLFSSSLLLYSSRTTTTKLASNKHSGRYHPPDASHPTPRIHPSIHDPFIHPARHAPAPTCPALPVPKTKPPRGRQGKEGGEKIGLVSRLKAYLFTLAFTLGGWVFASFTFVFAFTVRGYLCVQCGEDGREMGD
ncbi:hypothetical protein IWZ01DRAFT_509505 [Phyllosticta capitalensis]